jgi:hypothetical protein
MKLQATIVISYRADSFGDAGDALDDVLRRARERDDVEIDSIQVGTPASAGPVSLPYVERPPPRPRRCRTRCQTASATNRAVGLRDERCQDARRWWPASWGVPAHRSAEAVDDPLGVELLPAGFRRLFRESPFGLHELVHQVAAGRRWGCWICGAVQIAAGGRVGLK